MQVVSELADIEFQVGKITRQGENLIIASTPESTIRAQIVVSPSDAITSLRRILFSLSAWRFVLRLPLALLHRKRTNNEDSAWQTRRQSTGVNKPW